MDLTFFTEGTMEQWLFIWLAVIVVTIVIEIITVGLTSIWLTGGALASLIVCYFGGHWIVQIIVFFAVTFLLIYFTRPWAMKYLESRKTATNYEEIIGKTVRVIEVVNNAQGSGRAVYNGMEWTARADEEADIFFLEEMARVTDVRGVKLILQKIEK